MYSLISWSMLGESMLSWILAFLLPSKCAVRGSPFISAFSKSYNVHFRVLLLHDVKARVMLLLLDDEAMSS